VKLVAQFKSLAHAPAEGVIIRSGQDSIGRQALRRWGSHRGMISPVSNANWRNRRRVRAALDPWPRRRAGPRTDTPGRQ
jgi:hypothetical protein